MNLTLEERVDRLFASEPDAMADPWSLYCDLRAAGDVHRFRHYVLFTHYHTVRQAYKAWPQFTKEDKTRAEFVQTGLQKLTPREQQEYYELSEFFNLFFNSREGLEHTQKRHIARQAFAPRKIAELAGAAERYVDQWIRQVRDERVADVMDLAYTLPLMIICDLCGVPSGDRGLIHRWSVPIGRALSSTEAGPVSEAVVALRDFRSYIDAMCDEFERGGSGSELVAAWGGGDEQHRLNRDELTANIINLLFAGHETTTNLISIGLRELLLQRDQWERLTDNPERARDATEELIRFVSPVQWLRRRAVEDTTVGGVKIGRDASVFLMNGAANRDETVFAEGDRIDIERPNKQAHVGFGYGPHFCLGAALARLEGTIVFRRLSEEFPRMDLVAGDVEWTGNATLRRMTALPVCFHGG